MQCLRLAEEELAEREVDVVDIAFDELAEKHYKVEEVRHLHSRSFLSFFQSLTDSRSKGFVALFVVALQHRY